MYVKTQMNDNGDLRERRRGKKKERERETLPRESERWE